MTSFKTNYGTEILLGKLYQPILFPRELGKVHQRIISAVHASAQFTGQRPVPLHSSFWLNVGCWSKLSTTVTWVSITLWSITAWTEGPTVWRALRSATVRLSATHAAQERCLYFPRSHETTAVSKAVLISNLGVIHKFLALLIIRILSVLPSVDSVLVTWSFL